MKDFSELYPIRDCEFIENEELVTVLYKKEKPTFIEKIFFKKSVEKPYKIDLDKIGTFVWKLCDGNNNIEMIIEKASGEFGKEIEPAKERVELFINQMNKNRLITLYQKNESVK
mgnify:CR=1 FL=1